MCVYDSNTISDSSAVRLDKRTDANDAVNSNEGGGAQVVTLASSMTTISQHQHHCGRNGTNKMRSASSMTLMLMIASGNYDDNDIAKSANSHIDKCSRVSRDTVSCKQARRGDS